MTNLNRRATLFACAVEKKRAQNQNFDAYEHSFEQVVSRFDMLLQDGSPQSAVASSEAAVLVS